MMKLSKVFWVPVALVVLALIAFAATFVLAVFFSILMFGILWWAFGGQVTIKQDGVKIGTLRWFTFTRGR
jgi:membrane protein implicated in regulation of membrane protease activity